MIDIRIDNDDEGKFKFRVCGIVKHSGKILITQMNDDGFFCLPGGHVELGESTDDAVLREMKEELGYEVEIQKLIAVHQNFFKTKTGKIFHELAFYYTVNPKDKNLEMEDKVFFEEDKDKLVKHEMVWRSPKELSNLSFKPNLIKQILIDENEEFKTYITRD